MIQASHIDSSVDYVGSPPDLCPEVRMGVPMRDWTLDELYDRADWEDKQIGQCQRCSPRYWYFGKAMLLVQAQVPEGGWKAWCVEKKIQPDRWKRGRLLALAFPSPEAVAHLTVDAAVALARELLGLPPRQTAADTKLRRSLTLMGKMLQKRLDEFARVSSTEGLGWRIADVRWKLNAIEQECLALDNRLRQATPTRRPKPKPK